jgi:hypothetical protein
MGAIRRPTVSPLSPASPDIWPIGALNASGLASAEVFKHVLRHLPLADVYYEKFFAPIDAVTFGFDSEELVVPASIDLGPLTVVSAGAITQAALFTLYRLPGVRAFAEVYDDDVTGLSNINRNPLTLRSHVGQLKTHVLAASAPPGFEIKPVNRRFADGMISPIADRAIVGVDDIPSRWAVQRAQPPGWSGRPTLRDPGSSHSADSPVSVVCIMKMSLATMRYLTALFVSFLGLSLATSCPCRLGYQIDKAATSVALTTTNDTTAPHGRRFQPGVTVRMLLGTHSINRNLVPAQSDFHKTAS